MAAAYTETLNKLIEEFGRLAGIGRVVLLCPAHDNKRHL
jgi:hypothetical protein